MKEWIMLAGSKFGPVKFPPGITRAVFFILALGRLRRQQSFGDYSGKTVSPRFFPGNGQ